jgi:hypothetical protein
MSGGVLVENGTTIRMGFDGYDWDNAGRDGSERPMVAAPVRKTRLFMMNSIGCRALRGPWTPLPIGRRRMKC